VRRTVLIAVFLYLYSVVPCRFLPPAFPGEAVSATALTDAGAIKAFADSLSQRGLRFQASMEYKRALHPPSSRDLETSLLGFADLLFEQGHYYQAVTEYERFIYFNPDHPAVPRARLQIAHSYKMGGRYDEAIELYRRMAELYTGREEGIEAAFQVSECYRLSEDVDQALSGYSRFISENQTHPLADKARWNMAWTYLQLEDYTSARKELLSLNESGRYRTPAQELIAALDELPHARHKSPVIAGVLAALMPGAGHLYTGQKKQALFSFVTNALLMFGSYEAFDKEVYTAGGFLSLFSLNYYSGNIFGAITSAHKFNRREKEERLRQAMQRYMDQEDGFPPSRE
jgi:outer membrane protein assembly factor BamD (BamD/ComL family)